MNRSHRSTKTSWRILVTAILAILPAALGDAFICKDDPANYPYCVHVLAANRNKTMPPVIFLPGSGARGDFSQASNLAGFDGMGKQIFQYTQGSGSERAKIAAEQFLTIIPIASLSANTRHFNPDKLANIFKQVTKDYKVDKNRLCISGYSMGGRGTWRMGVNHPELLACMASSAGAAEDTGAPTLSEEPAPATFPLLNKVVNIPIWQFAGRADTTAGFTGAEACDRRIKEVGGTREKLTIFEGADHSAMSTKPWEDTDVLEWMLKQRRRSSTNKPVPTKKPASTKRPSNPKTTSKVPVASSSAPTPTSTPVRRCKAERAVDESVLASPKFVGRGPLYQSAPHGSSMQRMRRHHRKRSAREVDVRPTS